MERAQRIKDYLDLTRKLTWQRQSGILIAGLLTSFYFNFKITIACFSVLAVSEVLDLVTCDRARTWNGEDLFIARRLMKQIMFNTAISAGAVSLFVISMALQEGLGGHFTPLFFLFSASIFAAMYNSQIIAILALRLSIYGAAFLFIAFLDVVRYRPELSSHIWLNLFTVFFVLFFIVDLSLKFYRADQERLAQLKLIKEESERTKAAYAVKSQFISMVSHELRTPLTSIKAPLDLANAGFLGELPAKLKQVLSIAAKNSQQLANLVDDLLDLQKMEAGELEFHLDRLNVNELVKEAVESTAGYAGKLDVHVTTILPARELMIEGDHSRLIQVMNNLLSNALKFSHEGGSVQVRVEPDGNRVRISVMDEGVGIPENAKDRVFGKFSQIDSSDIRKVRGTGLGLNIAKQIVERHEGTLDYTSEQGVGSTFYVDLPLEQKVAADLADETFPAANPAG